MAWSRRELFTGGWLTSLTESVRHEPADTGPVHWLKPKARVEPEHVLPMVAKVMPFSCMNNLGGFCSTCVEQCPEPGVIRLDGRVPTIDTENCTGCGDCSERCPAPGGAILMVPEGT